jgi:cell fate regulator YaaT (PSP1 superfamily)
MQEITEYLLSYGVLGDFGRFRPLRTLDCRRGQRAVVRSHRGLEIATVLCAALPGHALFLPNTSVGQLIRLAAREDENTAALVVERGRAMYDASRNMAVELGLPAEVLDAEVLLDNEHAVVHYLSGEPFDARPWVSAISKRFEVHVTLQNLTQASQHEEDEEGHGCGRPDCGQTEGGGCSTCGTGGGCSTCGSAKPEEVQSYFAGLRDQMEQAQRTQLL